jgi:hypothetical protein
VYSDRVLRHSRAVGGFALERFSRPNHILLDIVRLEIGVDEFMQPRPAPQVPLMPTYSEGSV